MSPRITHIICVMTLAGAAVAQAQPPPPPPPPAAPPPVTADPRAKPPEPPAPPKAPAAPEESETTPGTAPEVTPEVAPEATPEMAPEVAPAPDSSSPTPNAIEPPQSDPSAVTEITVPAPLPPDSQPSDIDPGAPASPSDALAQPRDVADVGPGDMTEGTTDPKFIKGNLIHPGTRRLLSRYDHVGVSAGVSAIDGDFFLTITPGLAFYLDKVAFALALPLNFMVVEGGSLDVGSFALRREDWDEVPDYTKLIRFITAGRKEDNLYVTINSLRPATLGHGLLLNKYQGNIDVDRHMTGGLFDAYNEYGGVEFQANDITFANQVVGALAFIKPLSFFSDNVLAQSLSLGGEYVADFSAPRCIRAVHNRGICVQGTGHAAGPDPFTGESRDNTFIRTDPDTGRPGVNKATVHAAGFSGEVKVYKDERNIDLKVFTTYHQFLNDGGGNGVAAGFLGRFNFGTDLINALRLRAEYRNFGTGFLPGYFDSLYEINKYYYPTASNPYQVTPTKFQAIFGDPENGFVRPEHDRRHGFNLEGSWGLFAGGRSAKQIALGFGLQDSTGLDDTQFYVHLEYPMLGILQIFATYMKVSEKDVASLFNADMFTAPNTVVLTGARLQILPFLFLNAHYSRNYRVTQSPGTEYHLGNQSIVDGSGNPSPYFKESPLFENVDTFLAEIEIGWEFDDDE